MMELSAKIVNNFKNTLTYVRQSPKNGSSGLGILSLSYSVLVLLLGIALVSFN